MSTVLMAVSKRLTDSSTAPPIMSASPLSLLQTHDHGGAHSHPHCPCGGILGPACVKALPLCGPH